MDLDYILRDVGDFVLVSVIEEEDTEVLGVEHHAGEV